MADSLRVSIGALIKKELNAVGIMTKEKIPFLPKTISRIVFMDDGESVEHAIRADRKNLNKLNNEMDNVINGDISVFDGKSFDSFNEYRTALQTGEVKRNDFCIVLDDASSTDFHDKGLNYV